MNSINPTKAREQFYELLKEVNQTNIPIHIVSKNKENNAVIISESDWNAIQETLYLSSPENIKILEVREKEEEIDIDEEGGINWDTV